MLKKDKKENNNNKNTPKVLLISALLLPQTYYEKKCLFQDIFVEENQQNSSTTLLNKICNAAHPKDIGVHPIPFPTQLDEFIAASAEKYKQDSEYKKEFMNICLAETGYFLEIIKLYQKANYKIVGIVIPDTAPCKACKKVKAQCTCSIKTSVLKKNSSFQLLKKQPNSALYNETKNQLNQLGDISQLFPIFIFLPNEPDKADFLVNYLAGI